MWVDDFYHPIIAFISQVAGYVDVSHVPHVYYVVRMGWNIRVTVISETNGVKQEGRWTLRRLDTVKCKCILKRGMDMNNIAQYFTQGYKYSQEARFCAGASSAFSNSLSADIMTQWNNIIIKLQYFCKYIVKGSCDYS